MSFFEVPEDKSVEVVAVIGAPEALAAHDARMTLQTASRSPARSR